MINDPLFAVAITMFVAGMTWGSGLLIWSRREDRKRLRQDAEANRGG